MKRSDAFFLISLHDLIDSFSEVKPTYFQYFTIVNVLKLANISSIIEGDKKPKILSIMCFCGPFFLLSRVFSVTIILKIITVIIWLSKDNRNVTVHSDALGRHKEEHMVAHWKTKGSLENEQYQSQITKKDREKRNWFNCPQVSCDLKINHCHMKSHGKITPFSYGAALKKFRPFIGTVKGEAFELHLSCI